MDIQYLLAEVQALIRESNEVKELKGDNFNVFNICDLRTKELFHSKFIAEFLSPKGSHGFGNAFLELFCKQLDIPLTAFEKCNVYTEHSFEEGRIDIVLLSEKDTAIVIENKIYAGDQPEQLKRYSKWLNTQNVQNKKLFYLTLDGHESIEAKREAIEYSPISYSEDILFWLDKCIKIAVEKPFIRETLLQYKNLVKELTHQSLEDINMEKLYKKITASPENIEAAAMVKNNYDNAIAMLLTEIIQDESILSNNPTVAEKVIGSHRFAGWEYNIPGKKYRIRFEFQKTDYNDLAFGLITAHDLIDGYVKAYRENCLKLPDGFDEPAKYGGDWITSGWLKSEWKDWDSAFLKKHWRNGTIEIIKECICVLNKIIKDNPDIL